MSTPPIDRNGTGTGGGNGPGPLRPLRGTLGGRDRTHRFRGPRRGRRNTGDPREGTLPQPEPVESRAVREAGEHPLVRRARRDGAQAAARGVFDPWVLAAADGLPYLVALEYQRDRVRARLVVASARADEDAVQEESRLRSLVEEGTHRRARAERRRERLEVRRDTVIAQLDRLARRADRWDAFRDGLVGRYERRRRAGAPPAAGERVPGFLPWLASVTHFFRFSTEICSPPLSGKIDWPLSRTVGVPRKPPSENALFDSVTQESCLPSSTQPRNAGVSSPGTLPASSISLPLLPKASSVSAGWFWKSTSWYGSNFPASWAHAAALAARSEPLPPMFPSMIVARRYSARMSPLFSRSWMVSRKMFSNWAQTGQRKSSQMVRVEGASSVPTGMASSFSPTAPTGGTVGPDCAVLSFEESVFAAITPTIAASPRTATTAEEMISTLRRRSWAFSRSRSR